MPCLMHSTVCHARMHVWHRWQVHPPLQSLRSTSPSCQKKQHQYQHAAPHLPACHPLQHAPLPPQAMRLFVGAPVWTPLNRPQEENASRAKYLQQFAAGKPVAAA